jgi:uncharacterized protein YndB with AHSA1/START domain
MRAIEPIVVEQVYSSPVDKVWLAITDGKQMKQWFFQDIDSFEPNVGFETRFNVQSRDRNYLHIWKVIDVVPKARITYVWRYGGYAGDSRVTWELSPENGLTRLKLTHEGMETFPQDNPDFSRENCTEGWTIFICKRLKDYLAARS